MCPVRSKVTITVTFSGLAFDGGGGRQQLNSRANMSLILSTRLGVIGSSFRSSPRTSFGIGIGAGTSARAAIGTTQENTQDKRHDDNSSAAANRTLGWRRAAAIVTCVGGDLHLHHLVG